MATELYDFNERLAFSKGLRRSTDLDTIKAMIPGCGKVDVASVDLDRRGVDYIATLRRGAQILIDAKAREAGCSRYWQGEPEFALEDWSVVKENGTPGKVGWTLDEAKLTDLVLFTFAPEDSRECYLVSFQLLRIAFVRQYEAWKRAYKGDTQNSGRWRSHCIFVPVSAAMTAIQKASTFVAPAGIGRGTLAGAN